MLVLDTDHLVEYQRGTSAESHRLKERLDAAAEPYGTTIITVEETMRGWMAALRRIHDPRGQVRAYASLRQLFRFFATWHVVEWGQQSRVRETHHFLYHSYCTPTNSRTSVSPEPSMVRFTHPTPRVSPVLSLGPSASGNLADGRPLGSKSPPAKPEASIGSRSKRQ